jgi:hypothetical protein
LSELQHPQAFKRSVVALFLDFSPREIGIVRCDVKTSHPTRGLAQKSISAFEGILPPANHAPIANLIYRIVAPPVRHASDKPPSRAPQDFCIDSQSALNEQCIAATGAPFAWDCGFDFRRHNTFRNSNITHKGGSVTWDKTSKNNLLVNA